MDIAAAKDNRKRMKGRADSPRWPTHSARGSDWLQSLLQYSERSSTGFNARFARARMFSTSTTKENAIAK